MSNRDKPRAFIAPPAYDFKNPNMDQRSCHIKYVCAKDAHNNDMDGGWSCMFCQGGLFACTVCDGLEGALTTQCPGRKLSADEIDDVYALKMDFNHNMWWVPQPEPCQASKGSDLGAIKHTCPDADTYYHQNEKHTHDGKPCEDWAHCTQTSDAQK